jgi:hypothetical protein
MDDRLSLSVTHADGRITRWGPDEVDAGAIPSDLQFSTAMPGGFRDLSCSLLRRIDLDYPDQALFDNVRAYGPGNQTAWDGRFTQFPRSHGQGFSVTPGAVGWSAHLKDDPSFSEVYMDRDLGRFRGAGLTRRYALAAANFGAGYFSNASIPQPTLIVGFTGAWASNIISEAYYEAPAGLDVARIIFNWQTNTPIGSTATFSFSASSTEDEATFPEASADQLTGSGSGTLDSSPATPRREMMLSLSFSGAGGVASTNYEIALTSLRVIGNHGLTIQGTSPDNGFYASDMLQDIISRAAPMLSTAGIETTDFVIQHAVFPDPITAEDALTLINSYHLYEWGVYDDRVFFFRPPDLDRLVWEARLDKGAFLDLEGDTAEQVYNGVYVSYQDAAGQRRTIGPTGALADATSTLLEDTSETNPVNAHGIPRRWAKLDISQTTTEAGAEQLGYVWLREHSLPQRRGNLTVTGSITHPTEGEVPTWRPRAGDSVKITDGGVSDTPRRIISTSYNHGTRSISLALDNTSLKLDAILERMGVNLVGTI